MGPGTAGKKRKRKVWNKTSSLDGGPPLLLQKYEQNVVLENGDPHPHPPLKAHALHSGDCSHTSIMPPSPHPFIINHDYRQSAFSEPRVFVGKVYDYFHRLSVFTKSPVKLKVILTLWTYRNGVIQELK